MMDQRISRPDTVQIWSGGPVVWHRHATAPSLFICANNGVVRLWFPRRKPSSCRVVSRPMQISLGGRKSDTISSIFRQPCIHGRNYSTAFLLQRVFVVPIGDGEERALQNKNSMNRHWHAAGWNTICWLVGDIVIGIPWFIQKPHASYDKK